MAATADAAGVGTTAQVRIAMSDGIELAATLYLPAGCDAATPVPCLLEALPYRKDDLTASYRPEYLRFRDEYGYAVARIDLRGSGSSGGVALDEYHAQEQSDLHQVIGWLADRPWCTGAVGMFGTSWSGFNSLQLACERPPALKAIVASYATDDRWSDDVHYMGGALRLLDQVDYPLYMVAMNALPPVPELFGPGWRQEWLDRIEHTPPWLLTWLAEQTDGPYWRHGSVRPGYDRIACPTMLIAGWADGYRNNTFRTVQALAAGGTPVRLLAGPWSHMSPASSVPGPRVDHVPLMARWWDRWLRDRPDGLDPGLDPDPPLTVFVRRYAAPEPDAEQWPGRWEAHDLESVAARRELALPLADAALSGGARSGDVVRYDGDLDVGVTAWNSCAASLPWGQPEDQTEDDARSLCLDWWLPAGTVILGHPRVVLRVRPDAEVAFVSAKLSLAGAAGRPGVLVDRGLLNLAYRDGDPTRPRPCTPGEWVDVEIELEACAFELSDAAGDPVRLRLALACADWPNTVAPPGAWSAVDLAASTLVLPVSAGTPHPAPELPTPELPTSELPTSELPTSVADADESSHVQWQRGRDVLARTTFADVDHGSSYAGNLGVRCLEHYRGHVEVERRSGVQQATAMTRFELRWPDVDGAALAVTSEARLFLAIDAGAFDVRIELDVSQDGAAVATRRWSQRIPRQLA